MKRIAFCGFVFCSCMNENKSKLDQRVAFVDSALNNTDTSRLIKEKYIAPGSLRLKHGITKREYIYELPNKLYFIIDEGKVDSMDFFHSTFFIDNELAMVEGSCYISDSCLYKTRNYIYGTLIIHRGLEGERLENLDRLKKYMKEAAIDFIKHKTN